MYVFYLPHFAVLMAILSVFGYAVAHFLWFSSKIFLLFRSPILFKGLKHDYLLLFSMALFFLQPLGDELRLGQVNFFISALLVLVILNKNRPVLAGVCFALSTVKAIPMLIIPYFFIKKEWKMLQGFLVTGIAFILVFVLFYGFENFIGIINNFLSLSSEQKLHLEAYTFYQNQSLHSVIYRLFGASPLLQVSLSLLVLGSCCYLAWKVKKFQIHEYSLFVAAMVILSPDTRSSHLLMFFLPMYSLYLFLLQTKPLVRRVFSVFSIVLSLAVMKDVVGISLHEKLLYGNLVAYYLITAFLMLSYFIYKERNYALVA